MFSGPLEESLIGKAGERGLLNVKVRDIRDKAEGKHRQADDSPYGGGPGMVLKPEPIFSAIDDILNETGGMRPRIILMCPTGQVLSQKKAIELSKEEHLVVICGRYEGVDERVREKLVTDEISIGDYVLTGGEIPAMVLLDSVVRQVPGVVKEKESLERESFFSGLLDYPSYTRPEEFRGMKIPEVLLSGDHERIRIWRRKESLRRTLLRRPDLLERAELTDEDGKLLEEIRRER